MTTKDKLILTKGRLTKDLQQEKNVLNNLTISQVEQALEYLADPVQIYPPPQELKELQPMEWFLLERMLQHLMLERKGQPLQ